MTGSIDFPDSNNTFTNSGAFGMRTQTKKKITELTVNIYPSNSGYSQLIVSSPNHYETISNPSGIETIEKTFESGNQIDILLDGSTWTIDTYDSASYPYENDDIKVKNGLYETNSEVSAYIYAIGAIKTKTPGEPFPPENLQVTNTGSDTVDLDWDTVDADEYHIYQAEFAPTNKSDYTKIGTTQSPPYTVTSLEDGEKYYYTVTGNIKVIGNGTVAGEVVNEASGMSNGSSKQTQLSLSTENLPATVEKYGSGTYTDLTPGDNVHDERFSAVYFTGDTTLDGTIVEPDARKLGLGLIVDGNLTIDCDISMSRRGANTYSNSNVSPFDIPILNLNNAVIPAYGANGEGGADNRSGYSAPDGSGGGTGGGGAGADAGWSGSNAGGTRGTCFSGGTGSGGHYTGNGPNGATDPEPRGGDGGNGKANYVQYSGSAGGGAGNPGGYNDGGRDGKDGTGGLLTIVVTGDLTIKSGSTIQADGANGGNGGSAEVSVSGGGSGGGSINIYHKGSLTNNGTIRANGGSGGSGAYGATYSRDGGDGGDGTTRIIQI